MKLSDLTEGLSNILYHGTTIAKGTNVIANNQFLLFPTNFGMERVLENPSNKYFFMSTTRSKTAHHASSTLYPFVFVLDGKKLMYNYPGKPTAFFGRRNPQAYKHELEDRIFHDKPFMPNAKQYIIEIHIYLPDPTIERGLEKNLKYINFVKNNINKPVYVYENEKNFRLKIKKGAIKIPNTKYDNNEIQNKIKDRIPYIYDYLDKEQWKVYMP